MSNRVIRDARAEEARGGADIFATVSKEKLSDRQRQRGMAPRDLVLEQAAEIREAARIEGYSRGMADGAKEGRERGFREGYLAGEMKIRQELEAGKQAQLAQLGSDLDVLVNRIHEAVGQWYVDAENRVADLITDAARKLIRTEVITNREALLAMVREAMAEAGEVTKVRIRVNPYDHPFLADHRDALLASCTHVRGIEIVDDPAIHGGCVVESENGAVDMTLSTFESFFPERAA